MAFLRLIIDNILRNLLRTVLTALGTMVMVMVVVLVFSILSFLARATQSKAENFKAIVTERWQLPSQLPWSYASSLAEGGPHKPDHIRVAQQDSMTWSFFGGSIDPDPRKRSNNTIVFAFCLQPRSLLEMMDGLDTLTGEQRHEMERLVKQLESNKQGIIIGQDRLRMLGKRVGDTLRVYSFNYRDIILDLEILGTFPPGRYDLSAAMRIDYLLDSMDQWSREHRGQRHPMADRCLNIVWLRFKNQELFRQVSQQILTNPAYTSPAVKIETASSAVGNFLEAWRDIIWGMRYLLAPAIMCTLSLVIANSISISVRERRMEFAILKVLGFRPWHIMTLVLGEALLIGTASGFVSAAGTYYVVNHIMGGLRFPIAFFGVFLIDDAALWWGAAIGCGTAFLGSFWPAWTARNVRVAEVFARIA